MAIQGDRQFFQSCDEWKRHEDQVQVCSGMQNDVCGCLEAGCVAQEVSDSIACFAAYQPAAGGQIFAQDVHSECGKEMEGTELLP